MVWQVTRTIKKELCMMKDLTHDNVNRFVGACIDPPHVCIVSSYCSRGSLKVKLLHFHSHSDTQSFHSQALKHYPVNPKTDKKTMKTNKIIRVKSVDSGLNVHRYIIYNVL